MMSRVEHGIFYNLWARTNSAYPDQAAGVVGDLK